MSIFAAAAIVALGIAQPHAAGKGPASVLVSNLGDKAITVLRAKELSAQQREREFDSLLNSGFDLPFLGRFVLGRHWRRASAHQRAEFQQVFRTYVIKTYSSRLGGYSGETLRVVSERVAGKKDVLVFATIGRPQGPPIKTSWRVRATGGNYRIIDVMVEGISMAVTQRDEFSAFIRRNGLKKLIARLKSRTGVMPASKKGPRGGG